MTRTVVGVALFVLLLIPSAFLAWNARDMPQLGHFQDDALYWVSAKAVAGGEGYRILSLPGQPYETKYPPGYPLLLAGIWKLDPAFPANLVWAALFAWLAVPIYLIAARQWFAGMDLGRGVNWVLCAAVALNPYVVFFGMTLMPELLFTALLLVCLWLAERAQASGRYSLALAAGLAGGAAYLVKSSALPLVATAPLIFLFRRRMAAAAAFLLGMAPAIAAWNLWSRAHMVRTSDIVTMYYTDYLGFHRLDVAWPDFPLLIWQNLSSLLSGAGGLILFNLNSTLGWRVLMVVVAITAVTGVVRWTRLTGRLHYPLFAAGFCVQLLLWNFPPNERFLLPLFPLLAAGFAVEILRVLGMVRRSLRAREAANRAAAVVIALALVVFGAILVRANYFALSRFLPGTVAQARDVGTGNRALYHWIAQHLPPEATVLTYHDPLLYLYTGRPAARPILMSMPQYRNDLEAMRKPFESLSGYARQHGFGYFLLTPLDYSHGELSWGDFATLRELIRKDAGLRPLVETPGGWLYQVVR